LRWDGLGVQITYMILMATVGLSAAFGGGVLDKKGPRFTATVGSILFGIGTILAGVADKIGDASPLWGIILLYVGFGLIGGLGNGFGFFTPIATLIRWFPDKRGLVTGLAVMGFGLGSFFVAQFAPSMIKGMGVDKTFYAFGVIFLILCTAAAQMFKNPPKGWLPKGFTLPKTAASAAESFTAAEAQKKVQWWMLWGMLFLNVTAGLGLISQLSPLVQDVRKAIDSMTTPEKLAALGGTVVAITMIFNGLGRLFWASLSDKIGRKNVFLFMFATQAVFYVVMGMFVLPHKVDGVLQAGALGSVILFAVVACYLLACYGGGFATMPAFAADSFGPTYIGRVYGFMLTAWATAGIVGPFVFERYKGVTAMYIAASLLVIGFVITLFFKRPAAKKGGKK
jgi:MFS transporter, OFA family, oxalate/formate antiporter